MSLQVIRNNFYEAKTLLEEFTDNEINFLAMEKAGIEMVKALQNRKKIISCGNGGSMADAIHFAEELTGRFRNHRQPLAAIAISDPAYLTCTANDYGYDSIFARYVEGVGMEGDVLLAISTSGNSQNIINAAETAKQMGMTVVALTGKGGGLLGNICDVEIRAPHSEYSDRVQEIHIKIIHSLVHYIEMNLNG